MYEFEYDHIPDVGAYLERIGYTGSTEPTRENLNALVYAHQCTVPFENLDPYGFRKVVSLDTNHLFEKIVVQRRGGYCFEMNGLFVCLLRDLGYDAVSCCCRVAGRRTTLGAAMHRGCIVRLDGKQYFCDVGLGGPMAPFAIEISEEKQTFYGETYWVEPTEQGWYMLLRAPGVGYGEANEEPVERRPVVIFGTQPFLNIDFDPMSKACSTNPNSMFTTVYVANLRLPDGFRALKDHTYTELTGGVKTEMEVPEEQIADLLYEKFGLRVQD